MTASGRRKYLALGAIILASVLIVFGLLYKSNQSHDSTLSAAGKTFKTETARTQAEQERGLSGRDSLAADHAMIFAFSTTSRQCFWMKDMKFNIDMVWLDSTNAVTAIEQDVSPATYPQNFCHEGQAVVEFAAHATQAIGLKPGDHIRL